jgi:hypothetical protein
VSNSQPARTTSIPTPQTELQLSLLVQAVRSAHRARPGPRPGLRSCLQPGRRPCREHSNQPPDARNKLRRGWGLRGFSHLPGPGPASSKTRGPLVHIAVRPKACPSCQPAYGPLIMLDPRPGRPPAKPAPLMKLQQ